MADLEVAPKIEDAIVVCDRPDYCRSPKKIVPYQIVGFHKQAVNVSPNVNFKKAPAMTTASRIPAVCGDEEGTAGINSGVVKGFCKPIANWSTTVKVNGYFVLRHNTKWEMNSSGAGNTTGHTRDPKGGALPAQVQAPPKVEMSLKDDLKKAVGKVQEEIEASIPGRDAFVTGYLRNKIFDPLNDFTQVIGELYDGTMTWSDIGSGLANTSIWQFLWEAADLQNIGTDLATGNWSGAAGRGFSVISGSPKAITKLFLRGKTAQVTAKGAKEAFDHAQDAMNTRRALKDLHGPAAERLKAEGPRAHEAWKAAKSRANEAAAEFADDVDKTRNSAIQETKDAAAGRAAKAKDQAANEDQSKSNDNGKGGARGHGCDGVTCHK